MVVLDTLKQPHAIYVTYISLSATPRGFCRIGVKRKQATLNIQSNHRVFPYTLPFLLPSTYFICDLVHKLPLPLPFHT